MKPIEVAIVSLGSLKYPVNMAYFESWKSLIVKISHGASVSHLPDTGGGDWEYTSNQLSTLVHADRNASFTNLEKVATAIEKIGKSIPAFRKDKSA